MIVPAALVVEATVGAESAGTITSASAVLWALAVPPIVAHDAKVASVSAPPSGAAGKTAVGVGLCFLPSKHNRLTGVGAQYINCAPACRREEMYVISRGTERNSRRSLYLRQVRTL